MKASELHEQLRALIDAYGDLEVLINDNEYGYCQADTIELDNDRQMTDFYLKDTERDMLAKQGYFIIK